MTKSLLGRSVHRLETHNGVHIGFPPHASVEKAILHKDAVNKAPVHKRKASEMVVTAEGVYVAFAAAGLAPAFEMLVPWANCYEAHLFPEGFEPSKDVAPTKLEEPPVIANVRVPQEPPRRGPGRPPKDVA